MALIAANPSGVRSVISSAETPPRSSASASGTASASRSITTTGITGQGNASNNALASTLFALGAHQCRTQQAWIRVRHHQGRNLTVKVSKAPFREKSRSKVTPSQ